ncbi:MAG: hypothetical protein HYR90_04840, partial [Candidatus Andersenbacteria bacterium]|nr:hypothetical protein [Candidatus Andersenbacteria bacterium]
GTNTPGEKLEVVGNIISKGTSWTSRTSAADNNWNAITYGNGLFVATANTGIGNRVMTSPDGINWTIRTSPADNSWVSVTYGNGLFVAVACGVGDPGNCDATAGNRVMTSPDGITWTLRVSAANNKWYSVTYGNGLFVAVAASGVGNRVMTSPDGINWTIRTTPADNDWYSVTYGNGLFVAVSGTGVSNRVMTSPDGITWTSRTSAVDNNWIAVTYGNGLFVATSYTGVSNRVMTSPDGITWTSRTTPADNDWYSVTYGNGLFVAVAISGVSNRVMTSPDGITWTARTSAVDNGWNEVTYGNGLFVAVAYSGIGNRVMTSGKGDYITSSANNIYQGGMSVFGNIKIVDGTQATGRVLTSDVNGLASWQALTPAAGDWQQLAEQELTVATATMSVTIPARKDLRIVIFISNNGGNGPALVQFNNDAGANYDTKIMSDNNAPTSFIGATRIHTGVGSDGRPGLAVMDVVNRAATRKVVSWQGTATQAVGSAPGIMSGSGVWNNTTDQITNVKVFGWAADTMDVGSRLTVYGKKD